MYWILQLKLTANTEGEARWPYTTGFPNEMRGIIVEHEGIVFQVGMRANEDTIIRAYNEARVKKEQEGEYGAEKV